MNELIKGVVLVFKFEFKCDIFLRLIVVYLVLKDYFVEQLGLNGGNFQKYFLYIVNMFLKINVRVQDYVISIF